jgi:hypothetical protein
VKSLSKKYRKAYNADMPKMAVQGFDVVLYFTLKYLLLENPSEGVMSDFQMVQKSKYAARNTGKCLITFFIKERQTLDFLRVLTLYHHLR